MRISLFLSVLSIALTSLLFSSFSHGQFVSRFGSSFAYQCYQNATYAVRASDAAPRDLAECNSAIEEGMLNRRDLAATYINRGIIKVNMGEIVNAEEDYLRALDVSDRSPEIFLNLGNLQFMMQDFSSAISDYDHAESLGLGEEHILFLNRGMALYRLGYLDEAEIQYQKALALRPEWQDVHDKIAQLENKRAELLEEANQ